MNMRLPAKPDSVTRARHEVADYAARHGVDPEPVALAVSEAVTNAVVHGYRDGSSGEILVAVEARNDRLVITVADEGVGMSPNPDSPGLGFGLPLIGQLADAVEIEGPNDGTRVIIEFDRETSGQPG